MCQVTPQYNQCVCTVCYYPTVSHSLWMPVQIPFNLTPIETLFSECYLMTIKISMPLINTNSQTEQSETRAH